MTISGRHIIHIDMDAFYASVEQRDFPELKGKAVIVGGSPQQRGVVSAASYEARRFGVHSAMPMSQALKRCPQAIVRPGRMSRYVEISHQLHRIFQQVTPLIEPLSLDEAFLDVSGSLKLLGNAPSIGRGIKQQIKDQLGLVASVGIAPNKFLAKLASDLEKPDGFVVITPENQQAILDPLPISRIWGIGKVTAQAMQNQGIHTIGQLRQTSLSRLQQLFGHHAEHLHALAQGLDDRPVQPEREAKSISSEQTFAQDVLDKDQLLKVLLTQIEDVAVRLRAHQLQARTLTLKLRYGNFQTITRSQTLEQATDLTRVLWQQAQAIFLTWYQQSARPLRLLGCGLSNLSPVHSGQQRLFTDPQDRKQERVDRVFDAIRKKYGNQAMEHGRAGHNQGQTGN